MINQLLFFRWEVIFGRGVHCTYFRSAEDRQSGEAEGITLVATIAEKTKQRQAG